MPELSDGFGQRSARRAGQRARADRVAGGPAPCHASSPSGCGLPGLRDAGRRAAAGGGQGHAVRADQVFGIRNTSGGQIEKFAAFGLTAAEAQQVGAPLIRQCHASFECRLYDDRLVDKYNFFIFEVVKAHVAAAPKRPETMHYTGEGVFMISGKIISPCALFRPEIL